MLSCQVKGMNSHSKAKFADKKNKQKVIWVFQGVEFSGSSVEVENQVWDMLSVTSQYRKGARPTRDGVLRSIEGFQKKKEVENTRFPPVAEMISTFEPIRGPGEHVWEPFIKSIGGPPVATTEPVGVVEGVAAAAESAAAAAPASSVTIEFKHSTRWTPNNGDIVVIEVDGVSLWALNPTRLQLTSTESMKVLRDIEKKDIAVKTLGKSRLQRMADTLTCCVERVAADRP
eukprot:GHVS01001321.1.p1 GENE.GHVS01001321.1~~GHVS01001321.1.p1  ORF type:complete len:230 (+),score=25.51 GHVS01001321.1:488-1177(+)